MSSWARLMLPRYRRCLFLAFDVSVRLGLPSDFSHPLLLRACVCVSCRPPPAPSAAAACGVFLFVFSCANEQASVAWEALEKARRMHGGGPCNIPLVMRPRRLDARYLQNKVPVAAA